MLWEWHQFKSEQSWLAFKLKARTLQGRTGWFVTYVWRNDPAQPQVAMCRWVLCRPLPRVASRLAHD